MRTFTKEQQALFNASHLELMELQLESTFGKDIAADMIVAALKNMHDRALRNNESAAAVNYGAALEAFLRSRRT